MNQAENLEQLLRIREKNLDKLKPWMAPYGTALGRKNLDGDPAILVFVERKIHKRWLGEKPFIPPRLEADGLWCDTDVVQVGGELSDPYQPAPLQERALVLREELRGAYATVTPGSQLSYVDITGDQYSATLGAFARCRSTDKLGLLTNAHVGGFVGNVLSHPDVDSKAIARVDRLVTSMSMSERFPFVSRKNAFFNLDCLFAELTDLDPRRDLAFAVPWIDSGGTQQNDYVGEPSPLNLQDPDLDPIGKPVIAVGRTRGSQHGVVRGFAYQTGSVHVSTLCDYLIASKEPQSYFSSSGDSGKLILKLEGPNDLRPLGLLWGGVPFRTDPSYERADHSLAADITTVLKVLDIEIVPSLDPPS